MNGTVTANVLPCGMGNAGFWRYENYFPTAMGSSFPHGRAPGFALTAGCQCMETQAKSFAVDGAKCHHLRHGFAQCWEIMEGALRCQDCHHPLPLPQLELVQRSSLYHTMPSLIWLTLLEVFHECHAKLSVQEFKWLLGFFHHQVDWENEEINT